jgi:hypothetical protein
VENPYEKDPALRLKFRSTLCRNLPGTRGFGHASHDQPSSILSLSLKQYCTRNARQSQYPLTTCLYNVVIKVVTICALCSRGFLGGSSDPRVIFRTARSDLLTEFMLLPAQCAVRNGHPEGFDCPGVSALVLGHPGAAAGHSDRATGYVRGLGISKTRHGSPIREVRRRRLLHRDAVGTM